MDKKIKILHVEDVELNREVVAMYLQNDSIEIFEAETAVQAHEILKTEDINFIIMDIMLPMTDGVELTKQIREIDKFKKTPIIALTAKSSPEDIEKYSHIFDDYIVKPFDKKVLQNAIFKYFDID